MRGGIAAAIWTAIRIAALMVLSGCWTAHDRAQAPSHASPAVSGEAARATSNEGTRVITNLSQLSSAPSTLPSMNAQNLVSGAETLHDETTPPANDAQSHAGRTLDHLYLSEQRSSMVHGGEARAAGDRTLLNDKARQFPEFSYAMLNQTLVAAQELEARQLQDHKLPDEIKPVILTAVMTPDGKLTDISVEQHSGVGTVDRILIGACKKGLWAMNPPPAARADDGNYRIRFEGVVNNYSYNVEGDYKYITHIGLALL
jgi:hypothetical protein